MKIAVVSGSARIKRQSHQVAVSVMEKLEKAGMDPWLLDVKEEDLPLLNYRYRFHPDPPQKLERIHRELDKSDAFIIVSPEYNNSYSGAIKNTMDFFYPEYNEKPFGIVTVSAGGKGGINAAKLLLLYVATLQGYAYPKFLLTPNVKDKYDDDGKVTDSDYEEQMEKFLEQFIQFAQKLRK